VINILFNLNPHQKWWGFFIFNQDHLESPWRWRIMCGFVLVRVIESQTLISPCSSLESGEKKIKKTLNNFVYNQKSIIFDYY